MNKYTQTKPARRLGADITQSTLQTTLDQAGIDKKIGNLSYAEKRLVIIASLLNQVQEATNDWGKTLDSPANQTRILSEQWERLTRALGDIFLPIVYKVLPYVNGILMALTEVARVIAGIVASLFGFDPEDLNFGAGVSDSLDTLGDSLDNATKKSEKLKNSMLGLRSFDKIINISTPKNDSSGTGGLGISADIWDMANKSMDEYNKKLTNVKNQATEIRDKIMEWLGFTKIIDEETGEVSFKFDHITSGTVLGALAVGGTIFKGISTIYTILKKIGLIKLPKLSTLTNSLSKILKLSTNFKNIKFSTLAEGTIIIGGMIFSATTLQKTYKENEKFRKKVENLKASITNFGQTLIKIKEKIVPIIQKLWAALQPITEPIINIIENLGKAIVKILESTVIRYFTIAIDTISGLLDIIGKLVDGDIEGVIKRFGQMITDVVGDWTTGFKNIMKSIIEFVPNAIKELGKIINWFTELPEKAGEKIGEIADSLLNAISNEENQKKFAEVAKKILTVIFVALNPAVAGFYIISKIIGFVKDELKDKEKLDKLKKIGTDILKAIGKGITGLGLFNIIFNAFEIANSAKEGNWKDVGIKIGKAILNGITFGLSDKAIDLGSKFLNGFKQGLSKGGTYAEAAFGFKANGGVFSGGKWHDIQRYDGGGMPSSGQLFWARENGLPEMVGTIGGHTAVMNNDQIVGSVANGVYRAVLTANSQTQSSNGNQVFNIYLDKNKKLVTYTLSELQSMAKSNGKPIEIG